MSVMMDNQLPWDDDQTNERNYRFILTVLILLTIIFSWLVTSAILKEKSPHTRAEIPERFVKLVLEQKRKIVTPPPPEIVEVEKKEEPVKKEPEIKEKVKEKPKEKEIVKVKPKGNREDAIEKAKQNLAVFDVFADLRDADTSKKIANSSNSSADVGKAKTVTRDMIVNTAVKSSGGVTLAKASTNMGGAGLEGGGSRQVSSNLSAAKIKQSRSGDGGGLAERSAENIEKFMDQNKNSFFSLYNRALRKTPSMQGEVIFKIVILADGSVSEVSIVSSELNNPTLERKLLAKIRSIRFTAMDVASWKDNYRISFIPS
ncbi:MAG: hypothetical protein COA74_11425 [Gammaproteobacteria bacterium]|nr:MAG: hypothetical protein COA74_11425 [Gammaproteobacteria bacterium]